MGIPGFNTWFYENNKQAYVPLQQLKVDHLYVDMNSLLHNVSGLERTAEGGRGGSAQNLIALCQWSAAAHTGLVKGAFAVNSGYLLAAAAVWP